MRETRKPGPEQEKVTSFLSDAIRRIFEDRRKDIWRRICEAVTGRRISGSLPDPTPDGDIGEWTASHVRERREAVTSVAVTLRLGECAPLPLTSLSPDVPNKTARHGDRGKGPGLTPEQRRWWEAFWKKHYSTFLQMAKNICRGEGLASDMLQSLAAKLTEEGRTVQDLMEKQGGPSDSLHFQVRHFFAISLRNAYRDRIREVYGRRRFPSRLVERYGEAGKTLYGLMKWQGVPREDAIKATRSSFPDAPLDEIAREVEALPDPVSRTFTSLEEERELASSEPRDAGEREDLWIGFMSLLVVLILFCRAREVFSEDHESHLRASFFADFIEKIVTEIELPVIQMFLAEHSRYGEIRSPYYERDRVFAIVRELRDWLTRTRRPIMGG